MSALVDAIKKNNFVVFGRVGMDLFADPIGTKSSDASTFLSSIGGSSANICVGVTKLGGAASLVTSVSDDAVGRFCVNGLKEYGVDTRYVKAIQGESRTSLAIYESVLDGFENVIYRNNAADFQVSSEDMDLVDFSPFGAVVTAGTVFASEPSRSATFHGLDLAAKAGLPFIFDIDYRPYSWESPELASEVLTRAANMSTLIVGNDEEFDFMAGGDLKDYWKTQRDRHQTLVSEQSASN